MLTTQQIKDQLEEFSKRHGPVTILPAVVTAVNDDDTIAVAFSDDSELPDVRMRAVVKDGTKFLLIPLVGSVVLVGKINNSDEYVMLSVSDITDVKYIINGKFVFANSSDNLLQLMQDFITACLEQIFMTNVGPTVGLTPDSVARFDALQNRFNNFLNSD